MTTTYIPKRPLKRKGHISQETLRQWIHYDPETGDFVWRKSPTNRISAGATAGHVTPVGYRIIHVQGQLAAAARLAWLYVYGYWPENDIDHINRDRGDNRISNLREVSRQCNIRNSSPLKNNTSGVKGVHWSRSVRVNKWVARISLNNKLYHLGCFDDFDEAVCHRLAAEQCLRWSGCDAGSPAFRYVSNLQKSKGLFK